MKLFHPTPLQFIAVAFCSLSDAGAHEFGTKTWDFTYDGGVGADYGESIRYDSQGRLVVCGWITTNTRAQEALVFQITPDPGSSSVNWEETRGKTTGAKNDRFYSLAVDSADNIFCVGVGTQSSSPYSEPMVEEFAPDGTSPGPDRWDPRPVLGGTEAFCNGVAVNAAGEAFASTYFDTNDHNYIKWGVAKYSGGSDRLSDVLMPVYTYDHGSATGSYSYSNRIEGIALDGNEDICTVGRIGDGAGRRRNWHVRRYKTEDIVTDLGWSHTIPGSAPELHGQAYRVAIDSEGNPVVVGRIQLSPGVWTGHIVKYDDSVETTTGAPLWTIQHPATGNSFYNSVYIDRMGYYWVGGYGTSDGLTNQAELLRLDPSDGTILNRLDWDNSAHLRSFDIRDRKMAVVLGDGDNIILETYTPNPPEITLTGDAIVELEVHSDYTEPGFSAYDAFEREDLTSSVVVTDLPDTHTVSFYTVSYNVDAYNGDSAAEQTRTIHVVDTTAPEITLLGGDEIRVDANAPYIDPGFTVTDNYDPDLTGDVQVTGTVDTDTPGTYQLSYSVSDSSGNASVVVTRRIRVVVLEIATVAITPGGDIQITAETQVGMDYRVLTLTDLVTWTQVAVVTTPGGLLDWSTPAVGGKTFYRLERIITAAR